ncbi:MAG: RdgB/HAM1 family non-canonical purine NTP pyrophosphatase [Acholeplasma sp.]|jgi:XTP/dITP diphosphohydrolase|nr:RdgB/HAM1 family non-canonical purine NTP pyrophosphatase [Acholeplasma sp.]
MRLLVATQNEFKKKEIHAILDGQFEVISLKDLNDADEVSETGDTFFENALLKASYFAKKHQMLTIADDSGLCVAALNGAPGIFSARYSGLGDQGNIDLLLDELSGISYRNAYFISVVVLYDPKTDTYQTFKGEVHGEITHERKGHNGFGYDPIFYIPSLEKTMAEIEPTLKNRMSHRALALASLKEALK